MPQKTIFLTEKMIETINKLAKEKGEKFSSMCNALIEQGLKNSYDQERYHFLKDIGLKNAENILRTMHVAQEMFLEMKGEPSKKFDGGESADDILLEIHRNAKQQVNKRR